MSHLLPHGRPAWAELTPAELVDKAHDAALAAEVYYNHSSEENHEASQLLSQEVHDQPGWAAKMAEHADDIPEPDFDALYEQHLSYQAEERDSRIPPEAR